MKTLITKIAFVISLHLFTLPLLAHVEIDYPVGGEVLNPGQIVTIEWHIAIPHNTLNWDVLYSSDGGMTWTPIQMDIPVGQLSLTWQVSSETTTMARVSVIQDNDGMDYQDESMNFTIQNAMLPLITQPATNITLECNTQNQEDLIQSWLDNHGGASVTNFCADLSWTHDFVSLSNQCGATGSATVTFTATDACGSTETSAVLSVVDNTLPEIGLPSQNLLVECPDQNNSIPQWLANHGGATSFDECGNVLWTHDFPDIDTCASSMSRVVTFTATDECGNSNTTSATLTMQETTSANNETVVLEFKVFPNPAREELHIEFDQWQSFHLTLSDLSGKLILHQQNMAKNISLPLHAIPEGIYILQITTEQGMYTHKVDVNH